MIRKTILPFLAITLGLGILTACALLSPQASYAPSHPEALEVISRPVCSSCHGTELVKSGLKTYASFDHTDAFVKNHRFPANQDPAACATCHAPSFCADCHGGKTPMMPSVKLADRPDRQMPHRGNYLSLHRMDGKMDPSSCYKCHGRANNDKCTACHR
jgi:hypothetical protein